MAEAKPVQMTVFRRRFPNRMLVCQTTDTPSIDVWASVNFEISTKGTVQGHSRCDGGSFIKHNRWDFDTRGELLEQSTKENWIKYDVPAIYRLQGLQYVTQNSEERTRRERKKEIRKKSVQKAKAREEEASTIAAQHAAGRIRRDIITKKPHIVDVATMPSLSREEVLQLYSGLKLCPSKASFEDVREAISTYPNYGGKAPVSMLRSAYIRCTEAGYGDSLLDRDFRNWAKIKLKLENEVKEDQYQPRGRDYRMALWHEIQALNQELSKAIERRAERVAAKRFGPAGSN